MTVIDELEAAALNAWPAVQQLLVGGWVCRFAHGFTKRANSLNYLYANEMAPAKVIARAEAAYLAHGLPFITRIVERPETTAVDTVLDEWGYQIIDPSLVMSGPINGFAPPDPFGPAMSVLHLDAWLATSNVCAPTPAATRQKHRSVIERIIPERLFAALLVEGHPVACGLGVCDGDYFGCFDIVTNPDYRRRGYGAHLLRHMFAWAKEHGATTAYLQVMQHNTNAISLYRRLGFSDAYRYWYRVSL